MIKLEPNVLRLIGASSIAAALGHKHLGQPSPYQPSPVEEP